MSYCDIQHCGNFLYFCSEINIEVMKQDIKNIDGVKSLNDIGYYGDERITLVENVGRVTQYELIKLDVMVGLLCLRGHGSLYLDGKQFHFKANDLLICRPNLTLEKSNISLDTEYRCLAISKEYLKQLELSGGKDSWDVIKSLEESPVLTLSPGEVDLFCRYYDLIRIKMTGTPHQYRKELIDALLQAFRYELINILDSSYKLKPQTYSATDRMFSNFMEILTGTSPKPRSVNYYADKLCITPKYLSTICKKASGYTASELINQWVVKDIQTLLRRHDKSIKEVYNELDFPNLSFFGRYVKKHLGLSPKKWRENELKG